MSIVELNNSAWTPEYALRQALEQVDNLKHVVIAFESHDGKIGSILSQMPTPNLTMIGKTIELRINDMFRQSLKKGL